jgi:hypothetical protein
MGHSLKIGFLFSVRNRPPGGGRACGEASATLAGKNGSSRSIPDVGNTGPAKGGRIIITTNRIKD